MFIASIILSICSILLLSVFEITDYKEPLLRRWVFILVFIVPFILALVDAELSLLISIAMFIIIIVSLFAIMWDIQLRSDEHSWVYKILSWLKKPL